MKRPVRRGGLRVRAYPALQASVWRGLQYGLARAEKHATKKGEPTREQILEHCGREVMTAIAEDFDFDDDTEHS